MIMKMKSFVCAVTLDGLFVSVESGEAQETGRVAVSNFSASSISMHIAQKRGSCRSDPNRLEAAAVNFELP
jgi:hypothetical protein